MRQRLRSGHGRLIVYINLVKALSRFSPKIDAFYGGLSGLAGVIQGFPDQALTALWRKTCNGWLAHGGQGNIPPIAILAASTQSSPQSRLLLVKAEADIGSNLSAGLQYNHVVQTGLPSIDL